MDNTVVIVLKNFGLTDTSKATVLETLRKDLLSLDDLKIYIESSLVEVYVSPNNFRKEN